MATTTAKGERRSSGTRPEKKWGPFPGGVGVALWLNEVQTEMGNRYIRSITIAPRRYRHPETGQWEEAGSFRLTDIPALILALQAAVDHAHSVPLPGQSAEGDEPTETAADATPPANGEPPPF